MSWNLHGRPMLESLGISVNSASAISITEEVHQMKNKIDFTRKHDIKTVTDWMIDNSDETILKG